MHDPECDQPAAADDYGILYKLPYIIAPLTPEHPKLVEQKMASDPDKIGDCYGDQRW